MTTPNQHPPNGISELSALLFSAHPEDQSARNWKAFFKGLLDATGDAIFVVDPAGTVAISNQLVQKNLGVFPGSLLSSTLPQLWDHVSDIIQTPRQVSGIQIRIGTAVYLVRLSPIHFKSAMAGILCVLEDRTELEQTTQKMLSYQELSRELDAIISSSDDGLWICDGQGTILRINAASERLNMVRSRDVVGRSIGELVRDGTIDSSVTLKVMKSHQRENMLQQTRAGRKLMLTGNPVFNSAGELIRVVVNERDITEIDALRQELEDQMAVNDEIQRRIQEMQFAELESEAIIARSPNLIKALRQARKVSQVDSTVLILGESGAGKGVIARLIHKYSQRSQKPMIQVNCGAIPETLVESELFGYEKGAFTGAAKKGKPGYFELANGGILFLDEIAELPPATQVKLLHFLEDGKVTRVGGTVIQKLDVRIVCATHRDLEAMVATGKFRLDLYYRLNVIPITVPPLRDREGCRLPLIRHYLNHFSTKLGFSKAPQLSRRALDALLAYDYPGNVRELMNICERLVVMAEAQRIDFEDLPAAVTAHAVDEGLYATDMIEKGKSLPSVISAIERRILVQALEKYGSQAKAAEALGINQSTVARKLKRAPFE